MFIREISDVHLEFCAYELPPLPEDKETILVLAGDIGLVHNITQQQVLTSFLTKCSNQFRAVIYVLGNHEHYRYSIVKTYDTINELIATNGLHNVYLLENQVKVIDDVAFIGGTLWTDYGRNPLAMYDAQQRMNDHHIIRTGNKNDPYNRKFTPHDAAAAHSSTKHYIFEEVIKQKDAQRKVVVVVHHGVSFQSEHPRYKGSNLSHAYMSSLEEEILETKPDIIFHGHVHDPFDYMIGESRVIVNPRGYHGEEQTGFDPLLRIEI